MRINYFLRSNPNLLLIGGTGRNVGKTTLVCKIIEEFSKHYPIVGLKITNHFHLGKTETYNLTEEKDPSSPKDSSRMLRAGAHQVFYIESDAENLQDAFEDLLTQINPNHFIVCESNGLSEIVNPGVYLMVHKEGQEIKPSAQKAMTKANSILKMDDDSFERVFEQLKIANGKWDWE